MSLLLIFNQAEMRMAETRAVNRALRKAYGIGSVLARRASAVGARLRNRFLNSVGPCNPDRRCRKEPLMRTKIQGLSQATERNPLVEGPYRARVVRFGPAGHAAKPCRSSDVLDSRPCPLCRPLCAHRGSIATNGRSGSFAGSCRTSTTTAELLAADELDDRRVVGLEGVIRLAYWGNDGHRRLDVQGFAPSERWGDLIRSSTAQVKVFRKRHGLRP